MLEAEKIVLRQQIKALEDYVSALKHQYSHLEKRIKREVEKNTVDKRS